MASQASGGGEEWRAMDDGSVIYDPHADEEVLERARAGIATYRQREIELQVLKRDGTPAAGLPVEIVLKRHSFPFGDQLWHLDRLHRFNRHETDEGFYWRYRFAEALNAANALCYWTERPENDGPKIEDIQGRNVTEHFAHCVDWANSQRLIVKGHPLFWSIDKCVPAWVKRYDYETQLKFAEVRVRSLVARFRGRVQLWDAVNEALWEPTFRNLPGRHWPHIEPIEQIADMIAMVLGWARDEDPDATYLINDYGTEKDPDRGVPLTLAGRPVTAAEQRQRYIALVHALQARGAPPDAIGLQSHTGGWMMHSEQMAVYDAYAEAGVPVHVTEFWAHTRHLQGRLKPEAIDALVADYVANTLTCAFGHPLVEGFFFWGFMDAAIETREASGHHLKPVYRRVQDLLQNVWTTRIQSVTDADGRLRLRGFYGDYALRYRLGDGRQRGIPFTVDRQEGMPLTLIATGI